MHDVSFVDQPLPTNKRINKKWTCTFVYYPTTNIMTLTCQSNRQYFATFYFLLQFLFHFLCSYRDILSCIRIEITVLYLNSCRRQLGIWRSKMQFYLDRRQVNLHFRPSNPPKLTATTIQIQYSYFLIVSEINEK